MKQRWYLAAAIMLSVCSSLSARQGIVRTQDGSSYEGDVNEQATPDGTSVDVTHRGATMTIRRSNIVSIEYTDSSRAAFEKQLNALAPTDVQGRLGLAQYELERQQFDLARRAALSAQQIDPRNFDITILLNTIQAQEVLLARQAALNAPGAPKPAPPPKPPALHPVPDRFLTKDDINLIRQYELRSDDNARIDFLNNVGKRYLAATGASAADFNSESSVGQALSILKTRDADLAYDVKILDDPRTMQEFRDHLMRRVLEGCAASGCHGGEGFGGLYLYSNVREAAWYTNFYILQSYGKKVQVSDLFGRGESYRPMIDRAHPESSLIVQFGLPRALASTPHPAVKGFRPIFKDKNDPEYQEAVDWIGTMLKPFQPADYGIDFPMPTGPVREKPTPAKTKPAPAAPPIITQSPEPTTRIPMRISPIPATQPTTRPEPLNKG
jgi:hypothetical protein